MSMGNLRHWAEAFGDCRNEPVCIVCGVRAIDLHEYIEAIFDHPDADIPMLGTLNEDDAQAVRAYVRTEEGTYNKANGHFTCTPCYADIGMPSSPTGWVAP